MATKTAVRSSSGTASLAGVLLVLVGSAAVAGLDAETGLRTWAELRSAERVARARVEALERDVDRLRAEVDALASDPLARECAIREDLELARPGEWVVRFGRAAGLASSPVGATSRNSR